MTYPCSSGVDWKCDIIPISLSLVRVKFALMTRLGRISLLVATLLAALLAQRAAKRLSRIVVERFGVLQLDLVETNM
jgi:hypothetical protein